MRAGDFQDAARHLGEALALWTGPAFADVQAGPQLEMEARRLEEMRLCALDQRIEAELRLGRHRDLLVELTVLVNRYPTHENLHGQYMLALHRSGRRGEALEAYQRIRITLVRELGLEPSAGLRRVQQTILMAAPRPGPPRPRTAASHAWCAAAEGGVGHRRGKVRHDRMLPRLFSFPGASRGPVSGRYRAGARAVIQCG